MQFSRRSVSASAFLEALRGRLERDLPGRSIIGLRENRLAVVNPAHGAGVLSARVTFEGEDTLSTKAYPSIDPYTPVASHRVLMVPVGTGWVIAGRVRT